MINLNDNIESIKSSKMSNETKELIELTYLLNINQKQINSKLIENSENIRIFLIL